MIHPLDRVRNRSFYRRSQQKMQFFEQIPGSFPTLDRQLARSHTRL
jgi:hypothetical protein